ncbi:MAG: hypothetical protein SFZ24_07465 [Planctomycetota bacterium]|nr:hypothetical protein [Planctomycetota bacterium]
MKNVLAWIKANPLIVVFVLLVVIMLPAAYVTSSWWGTKIRTEQAARANKELTAVKSATVDYALPSFEPGVQPVTFKAEPNSRITDWFRQNRETLAQQAGEIVRRAVDFNKGVGEDARQVLRSEHRPLVDGLFGPDILAAATEAARQAKGAEAFDALEPQAKAALVATAFAELVKPRIYEMEDKLLAKRGNPDPYRRLLDGLNAGEPADAVRLAQTITDLEAREREKITLGRRDLTAEEGEKLRAALKERRLGEYQSRAREISLYASKSVLPTDTRTGVSIATDPLNARELNPTYMFLYQWDLWTFSDMFAGVRLANAGPDGRLRKVADAPVKRIMSVGLQPLEGLFSGTQDDINQQVFGSTEPTAAIPGMVPLDPRVSVTGRATGTWNKVFDVRRGTLTLIVSSARLGDVLRAIERANFITVTDLDIAPVDVWDDLRDGYYYGEEHVVQATIGLELVYLREWLAPYFPAEVRALLQIEDPATTQPQ